MESTSGEPIQPWRLEGVRRVQRWRSGHLSHWQCTHVTLGVLPDGRWFVKRGDEARAYPTEQDARAVAARMTADDGWMEVPANYDATGQPIGEGWQRLGASWVRT